MCLPMKLPGQRGISKTEQASPEDELKAVALKEE